MTVHASPVAYPAHAWTVRWANELAPLVGGPIALVVAFVYGLPIHAAVVALILAFFVGFGVTIGYHRLFTHRAFATSKSLERVLMVLGCMAGQSAPFWWIATHRSHHKHSDRDGDPHSPHRFDGRTLGRFRGFWHAHLGWLGNGYGYSPHAVKDLIRRPDLAWIDRHWLAFYLLGLLIPTALGWLIGGTAFHALMGFLWGGMFRHFITMQATFAVNSVSHLWGSRPYPTPDQSRNNWLVGVLAMGEGWHNNHHAHPRSARHGLRWWQPDASWAVIWLFERVGLVWNVRRVTSTRPSRDASPSPQADASSGGATRNTAPGAGG